jgi:hypothetical protein
MGRLTNTQERVMKRNLVKFLSIAALAMVMGLCKQASADPVGGLVSRRDRIAARTTDTWTVRCYGDEVTRVIVDGDGSTDIDIYVYDENGNLITKDEDDTDYCVVSFRPFWTQTMTVKIVNRGRVPNFYTIQAD